jgi:hypothetical protein
VRISCQLAFRGGDGLKESSTQEGVPISGYLLVRLVGHLLIYVDEIWRGYHRTCTGVFSDVNSVLDFVGVGDNLVAIDGNEMSWCQKVSESRLSRQLRVALTQFLLTSVASYESWFLVILIFDY